MWRKWFETRPGTCIGFLAGLLLGLAYLFFGFLHMLVFAVVTGVCTYIGYRIDSRETVRDFVESLFPERFKR